MPVDLGAHADLSEMPLIDKYIDILYIYATILYVLV